jgi:hypothetical protein
LNNYYVSGCVLEAGTQGCAFPKLPSCRTILSTHPEVSLSVILLFHRSIRRPPQ